MTDRLSLKLVAQPQDYFRELVTEALQKQKLATQPEIEFYLVNLMNQFMTVGNLADEPLALLVKEALEQPKPLQGALFRQIGDISLYTAGFFQDSLNRKLVDVDYYIEMGGSAYQNAAARSGEEIVKSLYLELAERFGAFVEVFAEISDKTSPKSEKDILRIYELWVRTRSERAARALQEAGILPNETIKKDWQ